MQLSIPERFALLGILPREESFARIQQIWKLKLVLAPSSDESKELEIRPDPNDPTRIFWNSEKVAMYVIDIPIDEPTYQMVNEILRDADKKKKITEQTRTLFEKFVVEYKSFN